MRWASVAGDAYDIGYQLGALARGAFERVVVRIERYREVLEQWRDSQRARDLEQAARRAFPQHLRELEGLADGAGVAFETVFAWNCRGDFPGGGDQTPLAGCTDIMARSRDSRVALMAHNEDDQPELDGECFLVDVHPLRGRRFVSFYSPGLLPGHTFAWNDAGLIQTINHLRTHDQRVGVPRHLLTRAVLSCDSVDDARALIAATERAGGFHHNLASCRGTVRMMSIEAPASGLAEHEVDACSAHANHLIAPSLSTVTQTVAPSSAARQARASALLCGGVHDIDSAMCVLADEHHAQWPIRRKGQSASDPGFTLASVALELDNNHARWRVYRDPKDTPVFAGCVSVTGTID